MEKDDIARAIARTEKERDIMAEEISAERNRFANEMLGGLGEEIRSWNGNEAKPIRVTIWKRLKMWAKRVTE